jgi:hypothetical protein
VWKDRSLVTLVPISCLPDFVVGRGAAAGQKSAASSERPSSARQPPNSHQDRPSEFQSAVYREAFAPFSVQLLVAVLMAVRYQLFCFWLRRIAHASSSDLYVNK